MCPFFLQVARNLERKIYEFWGWNGKNACLCVKQRFMKFVLGIGIGIGKNPENGIYEFWEWIGVGKIPRKWNSWISNLELICQWFE